MNVKHFFSVYFQELGMEFSRLMASRAAFLINTIAMLLWALAETSTIFIIYNVSPGFIGWTFFEVLVFLGTARISSYLGNIFAWSIADRTYDMVADGTFDTLLTKPVSPLVQMLVRGLNIDSISGLIIGLLMVLIGLYNSNYIPSIQNLVFYFIFLLDGLMLSFVFALILGALSFKYLGIESTFYVSGRILSLSDYPINIYDKSVSFILTFIVPVAVMSYYPAAYLLSKVTSPVLCFLINIVIIVLLFFSVKAYDYGLRAYSSGGG